MSSTPVKNTLYFSFSILELQSSGRRDELRLHYRHRAHRPFTDALEDDPSSDYFTAVENIPVSLADGAWHRVAVTVSGSQIQVFLDCK